MKKSGGGGKVLSFFLGMLVQLILLVGIVVGCGYYFLTVTTVGDVQEMATNEPIINNESEFYDMAILDAVNFIAKGEFKTITVEDFNKTYGIDLIKSFEEALDFKIKDGPDKKILQKTPVYNLPKEINKILNLMSLKDLEKKLGLTYPDMPIVNMHLDEPLTYGVNAIMQELNLENLTLGDLSAKFGIDLDAKVLQSLKSNSINKIGQAIENLALEEVIPEFDRDFYFKKGDKFYAKNEEYLPIIFAPAYEKIINDETIEKKDRFRFDDELGCFLQDDEGVFKRTCPLSDCYKEIEKNGQIYYEKNIYGTFKVNDGTKPQDRYSCDENGYYTKDPKGSFKFVSEFVEISPDDREFHFNEIYVPKYVDTIEGDTVTLVQDGYAKTMADYNSETDLNYYEYEIIDGIIKRNFGTSYDPDWQTKTYGIVFENGKNILKEHENGEYVIVHIGNTEKILKSLADCSLNTLNDKIGELKINDIVNDYEGDKFREITETEKLDQTFLDTNKNELFVRINDILYHYDKTNSDHLSLPILLRTYEGKSHPVIKQIANIGLLSLSDRLSEVLNSLVVRDFIEINEDYVESEDGLFVKVGNEYVIYDPIIHGTDVTRYKKPSHIMLCKIANIPIGKLGKEMQGVIDNTKLCELMNIEKNDKFYESENGTYGVVAIIPEADFENIKETLYAKYEKIEGTYKFFKYEESGEIFYKILANYNEENTYVETTRYDGGCSNQLLIKLADKTISDISNNMSIYMGNMQLKDVINIDGDIYKRLESTNYNEALAEAESDKIYYKYFDHFKVANGENLNDNPYFYKKIYNGKNHVLLKRLALISIDCISGRIDNIINDTTLYELGIVDDTSTGILANENIKNAQIKNLPDAINDTMQNSSLRELNDWGNLGMNENILNNLKEYNGGNDITAVEFFSRLTIKTGEDGKPILDEETGSPIFILKPKKTEA